MEKSVLIINGSTRVKGNTDILIERMVAGAKESGLNLKPVILRTKRISNCVGCYRCLKLSECSLNDDMTKIRRQISEADLIVLASPLYWGGVTGLMKIFIDRLFFFYHPETRPLIAGKRAMIITTMNQQDVAFESRVLVEFYKRLFNFLNVEIVNMFFFGGLMEKGAVLERSDYLEQAYRIGLDLR